VVDGLLDLDGRWGEVLRQMLAAAGAAQATLGEGLTEGGEQLTWRERGLDPAAGFIEESCLVEEGAALDWEPIWERFTAWWRTQDLGPIDSSAQWRLLNLRLDEYGFVKFRSRWLGIRWRDDRPFVLAEEPRPTLAPAPRKEAVTAAYRPVLERFLEECCERRDEATVSVEAVYAAYLGWCTKGQRTPMTRAWIGRMLATWPGIISSRTHAQRFYRGLALRTEPAVPIPADAPDDASAPAS